MTIKSFLKLGPDLGENNLQSSTHSSPVILNNRDVITFPSETHLSEATLTTPLTTSQESIRSPNYGTETLPADSDKEFDTHDACSQTLFLETADLKIMILGYKDYPLGQFLYSVLGVLTLGSFFLLGRWFPTIPIWFGARPAPLQEASWTIIKNQYGQEERVDVEQLQYPGSYKDIFSKASSYDYKKPSSQDELIASLKVLHYRFLNLVFDPISGRFHQLSHWQDQRWNDLSLCHQGLTDEILTERKVLFPKNEIHIPPKPISKLLVDEILHPFFIFQVFSIILWCFESYFYYAASIFIISMFSITQTLIQTRNNWKRIQDLSRFECTVDVFRNGIWSTISSTELVPGDIVSLLTPGLETLPCDSVLLQGDCIIGEGMLTGESIPVSKVPLEDNGLLFNELGFNQSGTNQFSAKLSQSILFSGTQIIRARGNYPPSKIHSKQDPKVQAVSMVIRTGFDTTKGALVRSILFPRPNVFKFYRDSFRFIGVMSIIAVIGFLVSLNKLIELKMQTFLIIIRTLDLATIVVPPALPATMSVGLSFSLSRLQSKGVYCISPTRINISGKVDIACFDKTGTLTEEGLDVLGAQEVSSGEKNLLASLQDPGSLETSEEGLQLLYCLATCHAIKIVNQEFLGDPLELRMLEATNWVLEEGGKNHDSFASQLGLALVRPPNQPPFSLDVLEGNQDYCELAILKAFEFVPGLRRMSVLVRKWRSHHVQVYTKGAPEVIAALCTPDSVPSDYYSQLKAYTQKGYRVIACAGREVGDLNWTQIQDSNRNDLEQNLTFLGFIVFENRLKPATIPAIESLGKAAIRQVMCTGDNLLTAISVARECSLLSSKVMIFSSNLLDNGGLAWESVNHDEFGYPIDYPLFLDSSTLLPPSGISYALAVSGECFRSVVDNSSKLVIDRMLIKAQVFARMSPEEKQELVEKLQELDYCVAFCGDGANDCGALKAADVGLSLSEAEASVAAPFTSKILDISSVPLLIKEGRAALVTSFSCFKYMGLYSIIQFATIILLYNYGSNLGDYQFLIIDLFIILPIAVAMGRTQACPTIHPRSPTASLVSQKMLTSFIGQCLLQVIFQNIAYFYLLGRPWFVPPIINPDDPNVPSMINTTLFYISSYQYLWGAVVFSVGYPYRRSMFSNLPFILTLGALMGFLLWTQFAPSEWISDILELVDVPLDFRVTLLMLSLVNLVVAYVYERYAVPRLVNLLRFLQHLIRRSSSPFTSSPRHLLSADGPPTLSKKFRRVEHDLQSDTSPSV